MGHLWWIVAFRWPGCCGCDWFCDWVPFDGLDGAIIPLDGCCCVWFLAGCWGWLGTKVPFDGLDGWFCDEFSAGCWVDRTTPFVGLVDWLCDGFFVGCWEVITTLPFDGFDGLGENEVGFGTAAATLLFIHFFN